MGKSSFVLLLLLFVGFTPLCAQDSDEIYSQQKKVIRTFYKLLLQESSVTITQANDIFHPEDLLNIEYYSDTLSEEEMDEFYYGDSDTLISKAFEQLRSFVPGSIFPLERSALTDSARKSMAFLNIDLKSYDDSGNQQINSQANSYNVMLEPTMNWSVIFEFYEHQNRFISRILLSNGTDLLEQIGLTK
tara:strand:+ start:64 stop:630 length:567 start_codon:yes stop_codon:yes gene_type:complete